MTETPLTGTSMTEAPVDEASTTDLPTTEMPMTEGFRKGFSTLQMLFAGLVVGFSCWHGTRALRTTGDIHPFTQAGWTNEQLQISIVLLLIGGWMMGGAKTIGLNNKSTLACFSASLVLALVSVALYLRYFWVALGFFSLFGVANAIAILFFFEYFDRPIRSAMQVILGVFFLLVLGFLFLGFSSIGK